MEMVAVALSEEYGVRVVSSGLRAHTTYSSDGGKPVITIPAVDTSDENYLLLLRGYIDHEVGHVRFTKHREVAAALIQRFGFKQAAITLRESVSANDNNWAAMLCTAKDCYFSKKYPVHIVDRVGGGDSFCAGLIYGNLQAMSPQETLEFATAASCLKHTIEADFNLVSVDEVKKLVLGDDSGRVQR